MLRQQEKMRKDNGKLLSRRARKQLLAISDNRKNKEEKLHPEEMEKPGHRQMRGNQLPLHLRKGKFPWHQKAMEKEKIEKTVNRERKKSSFLEKELSYHFHVEEVKNLPSSIKEIQRQDPFWYEKKNMEDWELQHMFEQQYGGNYYYYPYYDEDDFGTQNMFTENFYEPTNDWYQYYDVIYEPMPPFLNRTKMHEINRFKVEDEKFEYEIYGDGDSFRQEVISAGRKGFYVNEFEKQSMTGFYALDGEEHTQRENTEGLINPSESYKSKKFQLQNTLLDLTLRKETTFSEELRRQQINSGKLISKQRQDIKESIQKYLQQESKHFRYSQKSFPMMRNYDMIVFY